MCECKKSKCWQNVFYFDILAKIGDHKNVSSVMIQSFKNVTFTGNTTACKDTRRLDGTINNFETRLYHNQMKIQSATPRLATIS